MNKNQYGGIIPVMLLILVTIIWGSGFIITDVAIKSGISPSLLVAFRFLIPGVLMTLFFWKELIEGDKTEYLYSIGAGLILAIAFVCQTYGISNTTPANNAFLTATNVIMVPFLSAIIFKQPINLKTILCAFCCFAGAAILSWSPGIGITFNIGDQLTLCCAFMFAVHFAYLGKFAVLSKHTGLLCCIQLISTAVFSFIFFIAFEYRSFSMVVTSEVIWSVLYLALFPTGFCYFVQTWAQKRISPSGTAIILSLEGFFGSLFSVLLGLDKATPTFIIGGAIILLSVIAVQIEPGLKSSN
ncbi:MAG: DMT family transporter [Oscillospiraceae bacterium]|nr:DMT family transporter [Oscillospiraceae bacterium]